MEYLACHVISVWFDLTSVQQETQTWKGIKKIGVVLVLIFLSLEN